MSKTKTGALIVIARKKQISTYLKETGDLMEADVSKRLLESIFFKNSPLHDGAVIVANNKIKLASQKLPVTESVDVTFGDRFTVLLWELPSSVMLS
ncbi:MAG: DNA integrity scanning protein DisA nucleotide-binding domain protein [Bacteroidia bacterium]